MRQPQMCAVLLILCTVLHQTHQHLVFGNGEQDLYQDIPAKRFYAWEDGKRSDGTISEYKPIVDKRKQFYAWAGKRSADNMEKRKQFYAWAGRK